MRQNDRENYDPAELKQMVTIAGQASKKVVSMVPWLCSDDLAQAAILAMWLAQDDFDGRGSWQGFMLRVAIRACAREARHRMSPVSGDVSRVAPLKGLRGVEYEDHGSTEPAQHEQVSKTRLSRAVRGRVVGLLSDSDAVFILAYQGHELSTEDAAEAFGMTQDAVKARSYRTRKRLREDPVLRALWTHS